MYQVRNHLPRIRRERAKQVEVACAWQDQIPNKEVFQGFEAFRQEQPGTKRDECLVY